MIEIAFILLLYTNGSIIESSYNSSLGECLTTKRQVERHQRSTKNTRWACEEYRVELEEIHGTKFVVALKEKIIKEVDFWDPRVIR